MSLLRSMLFAPGNQARKVEKALTELPVDAVIVDLEDAVLVAQKEDARPAVAAAIARPRRADGPQVFVRVNGVDTPWLFDDLDAVVQPGLDGILLPKTPSAAAVYLVDRYLAHLEATRGLPPGGIALMPLIESAQGLANLREICAQGSPRLTCAGFGAADFSADAGITWTTGEDELLLVRSQLVLCSRLAGLEPPVDTVYPHLRDPEGLERTSRRSRDLGFQGRMCVHPAQIEIVHRVYSPTAEEVAWAEEVLAAFGEAEARGVGAIEVRGQLIDYAFLPRARRILAQVNGAASHSHG